MLLELSLAALKSGMAFIMSSTEGCWVLVLDEELEPPMPPAPPPP